MSRVKVLPFAGVVEFLRFTLNAAAVNNRYSACPTDASSANQARPGRRVKVVSMRKMAAFYLLLVSTLVSAQVTNYYVSCATCTPAGNDSRTPAQAQNPATPWATWLHANAFATLGVSGTIIHFADGAYVGNSAACIGNTNASFCITHGGTATEPLTYQCDSGLSGNAGHPGVAGAGHCLLRPAANGDDAQLVGTAGSNYVVIQGFDIGGDGTHPATHMQAGILFNAKDGSANHMEASYNFIHDMASAVPAIFNTNGEGVGCPMQGMIAFNESNTATTTPVGARFVGNWINNGGLLSNTACNEFHGMYIGAGPNIVVENNIVGNTTGSGIKLYGANCQSVVSNNLVYHTACGASWCKTTAKAYAAPMELRSGSQASTTIRSSTQGSTRTAEPLLRAELSAATSTPITSSSARRTQSSRP